MWARLDDGLADHPKLYAAGTAIGKPHGRLLALGLFAYGLVWSNKYLTDGRIPIGVVTELHALDLAAALVKANLWERVDAGFRVHDYHAWNPPAADVIATRAQTSAVRSKVGKNGARTRWARKK
jgi:hypothetical protein